MSNDMNTVSQLMEITGLDQDTADHILRINFNDLEQAINYHLENNCESGPITDGIPISATTATSTNSGHVRYSKSNSGNSSSTGSNTNSTHKSESNNKCEIRDNRSTSNNTSSSSSSASASTGMSSLSSAVDNSDGDNNDNVNYVRAPIPSRREQLLLPEEDNFRFRKRRAPAFTVCPLRNFAREAEIQEQQLASAGASFITTPLNSAITHGDFSTAPSITGSLLSSSSSSAYDNYYRSTIRKRQRLEDLFRPPTDLLFLGTFQAARDYATLCNRWLIVNLQDNSEFKSQILNRDIWPDPILKQLILDYFIFWQVSVDNPEGLRFKTFYHVEQMPYVCVIDPRTGENKFSCDVVTPQTFTSELQEFLNQNSHTLDSNKSRQSPYANWEDDCSSSATSSNSVMTSYQQQYYKTNLLKTSELSEEDQLELAIRNSLKETQSTSSQITKTSSLSSITNDENNESLDDDVTIGYDDSTTQSDDVNDTAGSSDAIGKGMSAVSSDNIADNKKKPVTEKLSSLQNNNYKQYLGDKKDPVTKIQLRLPGGGRDQFEWPSTTKLKAIKYYVQSKHPDIAKEPFKIILSFPRQNILELDDNLTLINANLHPSVILHLHPDD